MISWIDAMPFAIGAVGFVFALVLMARLGSGDGEQQPRVITEPEPKIVPPRLARPPLFLSTAKSPSTLQAAKPVGRNALCPCGSGKKAKKCHQPVVTAINEARTGRVANSAVRRGIGRVMAMGPAESAVLIDRPELLPVEAGEVRTVKPEIEVDVAS